MAACVDKWQPISGAIYRFLPDGATDRAAATAAPASAPGGDYDDAWNELRAEAQAETDAEPLLRKFYGDIVLSRPSLEAAQAAYLSAKLCVPGALPQDALRDVLAAALAAHPEAGRAARADLRAARDRDAACDRMLHCFLHGKGFLALQAHGLWSAAALLLQSRASDAFGVDIHPGARIGSGVLLDHATGVVIGETAVVGDDVSILHGVTLGGTGKESGDRHPKGRGRGADRRRRQRARQRAHWSRGQDRSWGGRATGRAVGNPAKAGSGRRRSGGRKSCPG